jgi:beta-mannosidase
MAMGLGTKSHVLRACTADLYATVHHTDQRRVRVTQMVGMMPDVRYARAIVAKDLSVEVAITATIEGCDDDVTIGIAFAGPNGTVIQARTFASSNGQAEARWNFSAGDLELWWPHQLGTPTLHQANVEIKSVSEYRSFATHQKVGDVLDKATKYFGIRRVELIQKSLVDQKGESFVFEINNTRMFLAGSCWVPADNMPLTISDQRYEAWIDTIIEGNQNVVRVWGGGLYEPDVFYDYCDQRGLLVMHDVSRFKYLQRNNE